jgi:pheromone shutdown-related protein TraB
MAAMSEPREAESPSFSPGGNVTRLEHEGREIFLVGTAHVSKKSVEEVRRVIAELRPDTVCVELDASRCEALRNEKRWYGPGSGDVLSKDRAGLFLASLLFAGFQKRLGDRLGVRAGMEMLAAVAEAERIGATVVLADREIQATLMRCYRSLGPLDRAKVLVVLVLLPFSAQEIDEAEVEKLKDREKMGDVMEAFAREMPALGTPLIEERDRYLMASIREAPGRRIVAVVGAAHVPGMTRELGRPADRAALSMIPARSVRSRLLEWLPCAVVLALGGLAVLRAYDPGRALHVALLAGLPTAVCSTLSALVAGAGVGAALAAFVLSPVTLLVPVLPLGRIAGRLELGRRPPVPDDALRLRDDVLSPTAARSNAFLRPLLVAVASSFGRNVGGTVGLAWATAWVLLH